MTRMMLCQTVYELSGIPYYGVLGTAVSAGSQIYLGTTKRGFNYWYEGRFATGGSGSGVYGLIYRGREIFTWFDMTLTAIKLYLQRAGTPGIATLYVCDCASHEPTATLDSGTTNADTLPTDSYEWRTISLSTGVSLTASSNYGFYLTVPSGDVSNHVKVYGADKGWGDKGYGPEGEGLDGAIRAKSLLTSNGGSTWSSALMPIYLFQLIGTI